MELTELLLYILIPLLTLACYYMQRNLTYWQRRGIPHDKPHPLKGNMAGVHKTRTSQQVFNELYQKYKGTGPFCGLYFLQRPMVFILDTATAKQVLIKDFNNFADRGVYYNERDDPLTGHLFAVDGTKWKQLRQKLSPTFSSGKMKFMFPTVVSVAEQFVEVFGAMVEQSATIEIKELMARFTTDVIGTCAFGIDCNSLKDPNAEFRVMGRMAFAKHRHGPLLNGFMQSYPELARLLRIRHVHGDVHNFFMRIVREAVTYREEHKIKRNDFMDLLIELKNQKGQSADGLNGLTVEQVAAQAFVFFLAGFETSSSTMSFALYELARHTEVQEALRKEINEVLAKHDQQFTYECMKELQLMDQVIAETLRLYTLVPFLQRRATERYVVPGHPNYVIDAGMRVIIPAAAFHMDPALYPEPHEFKPERFSAKMWHERDSVEWLPFGDGPRNCIGLRFGKMQARVGLAYLLKNFKFSHCKETQVPLKYNMKSFVLASEGGIVLKVEKIK